MIQQAAALHEVIERAVTQLLARQDGRHDLDPSRVVHALGSVLMFTELTNCCGCEGRRRKKAAPSFHPNEDPAVEPLG